MALYLSGARRVPAVGFLLRAIRSRRPSGVVFGPRNSHNNQWPRVTILIGHRGAHASQFLYRERGNKAALPWTLTQDIHTRTQTRQPTTTTPAQKALERSRRIQIERKKALPHWRITKRRGGKRFEKYWGNCQSARILPTSRSLRSIIVDPHQHHAAPDRFLSCDRTPFYSRGSPAKTNPRRPSPFPIPFCSTCYHCQRHPACLNRWTPDRTAGRRRTQRPTERDARRSNTVHSRTRVVRRPPTVPTVMPARVVAQRMKAKINAYAHAGTGAHARPQPVRPQMSDPIPRPPVRWRRDKTKTTVQRNRDAIAVRPCR